MTEKIYDNNKCPLCKGKGTYVFKMRDIYYDKPGVFHVFHCSNCLVDFIECPENLSDFYISSYFSNFSEGKNVIFRLKAHIISNYYSARSPIKKGIYKFLLGFIAALPRTKGRILDVGCGPGDILYLLKKVGFDVYGLDISEHAVAMAHDNGLQNVIVGMEGQLETFPDDYFDCIRGSHVLEHMPNPVGFLNNCYKKIAKNGVLTLSTPNINCWNRIIFGKYTKCYSDIPRHVILFSDNALVSLLKDACFREIMVTYRTMFSDFYEGLFCFVDSKLHISRKRIGKVLHRNIFINFILLPLDLVAILFKKGETMTVTAFK